MKLFAGLHDAPSGEGRAVSTVFAMEAVCRSMTEDEDGGAACAFPTLRFPLRGTDSREACTFFAGDPVAADRIITAQLHVRHLMIDYRRPKGNITIRLRFQYGYGYLTPDAVERVGLLELVVREAMCAGLGIRDEAHRRLVFALDRKDLVPVLELYDERRYGDIPTVMRKLAIQLKAANL